MIAEEIGMIYSYLGRKACGFWITVYLIYLLHLEFSKHPGVVFTTMGLFLKPRHGPDLNRRPEAD